MIFIYIGIIDMVVFRTIVLYEAALGIAERVSFLIFCSPVGSSENDFYSSCYTECGSNVKKIVGNDRFLLVVSYDPGP